MTQPMNIGRRNALTALASAASTTAMDAALSTPAAAQATSSPESNPYGSPPGSGISIPPYYRPTPSIRNRNNYFPQTEQLGDDEMRITFMGSNPFPPRLSQAGTCIMVECGKVGKYFFDFGPGCLKNIVGNQVSVAEVNDIFITHLHVDHYADLLYLCSPIPSFRLSKSCAECACG
jgi:ribonuclease Z